MVIFQTKNSNVGKFWRVLQWQMLVYIVAICYILCPFGMILWYIFSQFGMLYQEKSGNPGLKPSDENTCLLCDYFRGGLLKLRVGKLRLKNFSKKARPFQR
jgi:hypothetical protein